MDSTFDHSFEQLLVGSLCGDGAFRRKKLTHNPSYYEKHSVGQREYSEWKIDMFKKYFSVKTEFGDSKLNGKTYPFFRFETPVDTRFLKYQEMAYPQNQRKKVITEELLNLIDWEGIAVWFCDDGSFQQTNGAVYLYSNLSSIPHILSFFKQKGFSPQPTGKYGVYFNQKDSKAFKENIKPYVLKMPQSIHYKIGLDFERIYEVKKRARTRQKEYGRLYTQKNRARINTQKRERYYQDPERHRAYRKKYYLFNQEKCKTEARIRSKEYLKNPLHKLRANIRSKEWYEQNKDVVNARKRFHRHLKKQMECD